MNTSLGLAFLVKRHASFCLYGAQHDSSQLHINGEKIHFRWLSAFWLIVISDLYFIRIHRLHLVAGQNCRANVGSYTLCTCKREGTYWSACLYSLCVVAYKPTQDWIIGIKYSYPALSTLPTAYAINPHNQDGFTQNDFIDHLSTGNYIGLIR